MSAVVTTAKASELGQERPREVALEQALAYQNDQIPLRFMDDWDVSLDEARLLFDDVKRWLWLQSQCEWKGTFLGPMSIVDEMFHVFILFTTEYTAYCKQTFGHYIHHAPITDEKKQEHAAAQASDPEGNRQRELEYRDWLRRTIAEKLGPEVLIRWWVDYPAKYGDEFFRTRHKPPTVHWQPDAAVLALAAEIREDA